MNTIIRRIVIVSLLGFGSATAGELIQNPTFTGDQTPWLFLGSGSYTHPAGSDSSGSFISFNITNGGSTIWDVMLYQGKFTFKKGYWYTLEWKAQRDSGKMVIELSTPSNGYTLFISDTIKSKTMVTSKPAAYHHCTPTIADVSVYVTMGGNNASAKISKISVIESDTPSVCIDPIKLYKDTCDAIPNLNAMATNPGRGPVSYYGKLQACGNRIIGTRIQNPAQVRGMSLFWSQWAKPFYNSKAIATVAKNWDVEIVRAAMAVEVAGGYLSDSANQLALADSVIKAAIDNDIYVLIDFHSSSASSYEPKAIEYFTRMAQKWGRFDHVIFEIFNEPLTLPWVNVSRYAERVIAAIRKHSDNLVLVGTPNWCQDVEVVVKNQINDKNVAYTVHFYAVTHQAAYRTKARTALAGHIPLMATEWGTVEASGNGTADTNASNVWMSFLDSNYISWTNWSLFNKAEGASALIPGSYATGEGWTSKDTLTASGVYVVNKLLYYGKTAPWKKAGIVPRAHTQARIRGIPGLRVTAQKISYSWKRGMPHTLRIYTLSGHLAREMKIGADAASPSFACNVPAGYYLVVLEGKTFRFQQGVVAP